MFRKFSFIFFIVFAFVLTNAASAQTIRFKVKADAFVAKESLSGRLLIFMTNNPKSLETIELKDKGTFVCVCCDLPLFSSETKFDSQTGWLKFIKA